MMKFSWSHASCSTWSSLDKHLSLLFALPSPQYAPQQVWMPDDRHTNIHFNHARYNIVYINCTWHVHVTDFYPLVCTWQSQYCEQEYSCILYTLSSICYVPSSTIVNLKLCTIWLCKITSKLAVHNQVHITNFHHAVCTQQSQHCEHPTTDGIQSPFHTE